MSSIEIVLSAKGEGKETIELMCGNCGHKLSTSADAADALINKLVEALPNDEDDIPMDETVNIRGFSARLKAGFLQREPPTEITVVDPDEEPPVVIKGFALLKCEKCGNCPIEFRFEGLAENL